MNEVKKIILDIQQGKISPIYFLVGAEPFFIDQVSSYIENNLLKEEERDFNQMVIYGQDIDIPTLISYAQEYPAFAERKLIIVKEAQNIKKIDDFYKYLKDVNFTTTIVFCYKADFDGRKQIAKELKKSKEVVYLESKSLRDYEIDKWLVPYLKENGFTITSKATTLFIESLGTDLSKYANEISKLKIIYPQNTQIDEHIVEKHIGISKNFNNFEFQDAIASKNFEKASFIAKYFAENQKEYPLIVIISAVLYPFFENLLAYHANPHTFPQRLKGNQQFFLKKYQIASQLYPMKKVSQCIEVLKEFDAKSKGLNSGTANYSDLMKELLVRIFS